MEDFSNRLVNSVNKMLSNLPFAIVKGCLNPVKIRKDGRVTVVFWQDNTTTAVRCGESEPYDDYTAFCAALAKKIFGNNSSLKRTIQNCPVEFVVRAADLND